MLSNVIKMSNDILLNNIKKMSKHTEVCARQLNIKSIQNQKFIYVQNLHSYLRQQKYIYCSGLPWSRILPDSVSSFDFFASNLGPCNRAPLFHLSPSSKHLNRLHIVSDVADCSRNKSRSRPILAQIHPTRQDYMPPN